MAAPARKALLDASEARRLVASFHREWSKTDISNIRVQRITGGLVNTLHLVRRESPSIKEPACVLVRHFGLPGKHEEPQETSLTLSSAQQALVYWEMGRRGWGPKIYGCFQGGRVEEYIDSHTLTAAEASQPAIQRDVARSYARLHSLQLPLRRDGSQTVIDSLSESARTKRQQVLDTLAEIDDPRAKEYAALFAETDWASELEWVLSLSEQHNCKVTVTHGDANYLNILVRDHPDPKDGECRALLIDYETAAYGPRGYDLGGHFSERQYVYDNPHTQFTGHGPYTPAEQRAFCAAYLAERQRLLEQEGLEGQVDEFDTVEHLLLEAEIGRMQQLLVTNLMCTVFDEVEAEPLFLSGIGHMMAAYWELKEGFLRAHA